MIFEGSYINGKHHFTRSVLGIRPLAVVIQLMRNSLPETFGQDYIRTARAKDYLNQIIRKHALKLIKPSRYCNFRMVCRCLQVQFC
jgi:peptide/nickel transport system permease protein